MDAPGASVSTPFRFFPETFLIGEAEQGGGSPSKESGRMLIEDQE